MRLGVKGLIFDLDNTLAPPHSETAPPATLRFLAEVRRAGLAAVIVSNGRRPRVERLGRLMGLPVVARARKPFGRGYRWALLEMGLKASQVAAVGDHFLTDGLGALYQGIPLVLVDPMTSEEDFLVRAARPVDHILRRLALTRRERRSPRG